MMGKVTNASSNSELTRKRRPHCIKPKVIKPAVKVTVKRLTNLKRRIRDLLAERYSWENKNKQLSDSLKDEKLANTSLQKDLFECRKLHHEAITSLNSYKMKQQEIRRTIAAYQVANNPFPHLLVLSECLTNNKLRIDKLNTLLSSGDQNNALSRQIDDSSTNYCYKKNSKLTEPVGRVGPRVKGLLISKPQIMLERVMLPHTNDPEPDSQEASADTSTLEHNIPLSPIQEEQQDEEIPLRHGISYRRKKKPISRLGKCARRDKSTENINDSQIPFDLNNTAASNSPLMNRMEPVARLRDVSRLLHNSSLIQMDSGQLENVEHSSNNFQEKEGQLFRNSHGQMPSDDPLEGCSWMTDQNYRSSTRKSRFTHVSLPSDSSDDDSDSLPLKKHNTSYTSPLPNPLMNSTANSTNCRRTYLIANGGGSNSPKDTGDVSSSPNAEPDSTSQSNLRDDSSNLSPTDKFTDSNSISAEYSFFKRNSSKQKIKKSNAHHQLMHVDEGLQIDSNIQNRSKSQTPEKLEKRKRKPKNHAYPGEEDISPKKGKVSCGRLSVGNQAAQGKRSTGRKSLNKQKKSLQKSVSTGTKANLASPKSKQKKSVQNNVSTGTKANLISPKSSIKQSSRPMKQSQNSSVQENAENTKNTKLRSKRSSKRSQIVTPRNSECNINSNESVRDIDDHSSVRSRRNASKISYKESPLNVKLRRN